VLTSNIINEILGILLKYLHLINMTEVPDGVFHFVNYLLNVESIVFGDDFD
jgi:hypothetical protein